MREWTSEMLDEMSRIGDGPADQALAEVALHGDVRRVNRVFRSFAADDARVPADAPDDFLEFVASTRRLPEGIDRERVARGATLILNNATLYALVLMLKSLPTGYAAPRLANVLHMTHNLEKRPYRRALGVLQMLVNISQPNAFSETGAAVVTGQKLRLLHAGVRKVVGSRIPAFAGEFGTPVSQLDMTYTIMTFSVLAIDGLTALGVPLSDDEAADVYHFWQMYGILQGIEPRFMPESAEEGRVFCRAYAREFRSAADNPNGVSLTRADLDMMKSLIPWPLRVLGLGGAPKMYLLRLLGEEEAARVGITRSLGNHWNEWIVMKIPALWKRLWNALTPERDVHQRVSLFFFRALIIEQYGREVSFRVPLHIQDFRKLA